MTRRAPIALVLAICARRRARARRTPSPTSSFAADRCTPWTPTRPHATAVAVTGTRIIYVGDDAGVDTLIGPKTRVIDARGADAAPRLSRFARASAHRGASPRRVRARRSHDAGAGRRLDREVREGAPERRVVSRARLAAAGVSARESEPRAARQSRSRSPGVRARGRRPLGVGELARTQTRATSRHTQKTRPMAASSAMPRAIRRGRCAKVQQTSSPRCCRRRRTSSACTGSSAR